MGDFFMQQPERFRLAQYMYVRGNTLAEIKNAIELIELKPIAQDDWHAIVVFIKD
jgi:hypothetical protein